MLDELKDILKKTEDIKKQLEFGKEFDKLLNQMCELNPFEDGKKFNELLDKASELFDKLDMKKEYGGYSFKELLNMKNEDLIGLLNNTTEFSIKDKDGGIEMKVRGRQGDIANYVANGIVSWLKKAIKDNKLSKESAFELVDLMFKGIKEQLEEK